MKIARYLFLFLLVLMSTALTSVAFAQDDTPLLPTDDEVNAIARQMYCPVCENTPLDVCPTQACADWREEIRDKLALGWTEAQIKAYFVERYGDRVLAEPPRRGLNWLVYVAPPLAFAVGVFILYRAFRMWRQPSPEVAGQPADEPVSQPASDDEYIQRLEEELLSRRR